MKANKKQLAKMAAEANPYKIGSPYGLDTRGYKEGFPAGYEKRSQEIIEGRMSDEELRRRIEATYESNMVHFDTEALMNIAKQFANI